MINQFNDSAILFMNRFVAEVLNNRGIVELVSYNLDLLKLFVSISTLDSNLLVIGRTRVWMIIMSTCHRDHFIGTERVLHLKPRLRDLANWTRLHDFVFRYSTPGARIHAYLLRGFEVPKLSVCEMVKHIDAEFKLPDCNLPPLNGIFLGSKVKIPITKEVINENWI